MKRAAWVVGVAMVLVSQPVWAARTQIHDAAESSQYGRKAGGMLGRGLLNVTTSFVDVLVNLVNETKAGPPFVGTLTGIAKGTGCTILRAGSGAVDLVTFWVPGFNGFPVSDSYTNCLEVSGAQVSWRAPAAPVEIQPASTWEPSPLPAVEPSLAQVPDTSTSSAAAPAAPTPKKTWTK